MKIVKLKMCSKIVNEDSHLLNTYGKSTINQQVTTDAFNNNSISTENKLIQKTYI